MRREVHCVLMLRSTGAVCAAWSAVQFVLMCSSRWVRGDIYWTMIANWLEILILHTQHTHSH